MPAFGVSTILFVFSLVRAVADWQERTAWLGAAIASLPFLLVMLYLMPKRVERTSENLPILLLLSAVGVTVSMWEQFMERTSGWLPTSVALTSAGLFVIYVFWYSRFGRIESHQLSVGSMLPEFELEDSDAKIFRSGELTGAPAVLLFYRGNWCPLCMAQIREIAARYQELDDMGVKVVLISPQPLEYSHMLAKRFEVPFRFLVDPDNKLAESLGIAIRNGVPVGIPGGYLPDTVLPTVVVTSPTGRILFSDQTDNYRVRPEPDVFLAILRRSGVVATT